MDLNFKNWFIENTISGTKPFGEEPQSPSKNEPISAQGIKGLHHMERIRRGMAMEEKIKDALRKEGFIVKDPTIEQDMKQQIDAFVDIMAPTDKNLYPIQIKYRNQGLSGKTREDIRFEIVRDFDPTLKLGDQTFLGKDYISSSKYFVLLSSDGKKLHIIPMATIRFVVDRIIKKIKDRNIPERGMAVDGIELLQIPNTQTGGRKLVVFIPSFFATKSIPVDLNFAV